VTVVTVISRYSHRL